MPWDLDNRRCWEAEPERRTSEVDGSRCWQTKGQEWGRGEDFWWRGGQGSEGPGSCWLIYEDDEVTWMMVVLGWEGWEPGTKAIWERDTEGSESRTGSERRSLMSQKGAGASCQGGGNVWKWEWGVEKTVIPWLWGAEACGEWKEQKPPLQKLQAKRCPQDKASFQLRPGIGGISEIQGLPW